MIRMLPALALLLAGCAGGDGGTPAPVAGPTIVSLNPCTDAVLAEVTAPGQLLAISHYSKDPGSSSMDPRKAALFRATGGTVEEVVALDPDVVVASDFIAPATRAALDDFGIDIVTLGIATDVEESKAQVRQLAALAGDREAGEGLVARIEAAIQRAGGPAGARVGALLWQPGGIVAGQASLVDDLLILAGFENQAVARGLHQADYVALEEIVASPPQVLLVAGSEASQTHPVLDRLPGMRREQFDTRLIYCGGPTIIRALDRLDEIRRRMP